MPPLTFAVWYFVRRGKWTEHTYWILTALAAVQLLNLPAALWTGHAARFFSAGSQDAILYHQKMAYWFSALAGVLFLLLLVGRIRPRLQIHSIWWMTIWLALIAQLILAFDVGHLGGQLMGG
ncbi:MAG: hypothetical protein AB7F86_05805 [Bdellovibrionales bacterium]